jgi:rubredoxin
MGKMVDIGQGELPLGAAAIGYKHTVIASTPRLTIRVACEECGLVLEFKPKEPDEVINRLAGRDDDDKLTIARRCPVCAVKRVFKEF